MSNITFDLFFQTHINSKYPFYIVPGGNTPILFYNKLSNSILNWTKSSFILSDERMVNKNNSLSNQKMFRESFLNKLSNDNNPYLFSLFSKKSILENKLINLTPTLALLGIGSDGHTASVFPHPKIPYETKKVITNHKNIGENFTRLSLTLSYLMSAKKIIFLASGKQKAEALNQCLNGPYNPEKYPTQYILKNYKNGIDIIFDKDAKSF